jgi:hypothetical protein
MLPIPVSDEYTPRAEAGVGVVPIPLLEGAVSSEVLGTDVDVRLAIEVGGTRSASTFGVVEELGRSMTAKPAPSDADEDEAGGFGAKAKAPSSCGGGEVGVREAVSVGGEGVDAVGDVGTEVEGEGVAAASSRASAWVSRLWSVAESVGTWDVGSGVVSAPARRLAVPWVMVRAGELEGVSRKT